MMTGSNGTANERNLSFVYVIIFADTLAFLEEAAWGLRLLDSHVFFARQ